MGLGNWISTPQQLTMGLPQGSTLSPVLYNVYTKGLADLNSNGLHLRTTGLSTNSQWNRHSSHRCPGAPGKGVTLVPGDRVQHQPKQGASPVVHPQKHKCLWKLTASNMTLWSTQAARSHPPPHPPPPIKLQELLAVPRTVDWPQGSHSGRSWSAGSAWRPTCTCARRGQRGRLHSLVDSARLRSPPSPVAENTAIPHEDKLHTQNTAIPHEDKLRT